MRECAIQLDAEVRAPLTSSSFKDPNVAALRQKVFAEMVSQQGKLDADLLHQFHRSHLPDRGPYSVCMHRDDAATVSLSTVKVTRDTIEFIYHPRCSVFGSVGPKGPARSLCGPFASSGFMRIGKRILKQLVAWKWRILLAYLLLLAASYIVRWKRFT